MKEISDTKKVRAYYPSEASEAPPLWCEDDLGDPPNDLRLVERHIRSPLSVPLSQCGLRWNPVSNTGAGVHILGREDTWGMTPLNWCGWWLHFNVHRRWNCDGLCSLIQVSVRNPGLGACRKTITPGKTGMGLPISRGTANTTPAFITEPKTTTRDDLVCLSNRSQVSYPFPAGEKLAPYGHTTYIISCS